MKIPTLTVLLTFATITHGAPSGQTSLIKGPYTPINSHSEAELARVAHQKMKGVRLDKKYDMTRPFLLRTPSQVGDALVAYTIATAKPDTNGYIEVFCLVDVNTFAGTAGRMEELPGGRGERWYAILDRKGKVEGYTAHDFRTVEPTKKEDKTR